MNPVSRLLLIAVVGLSVLTGAVLVASSQDGVSFLDLIAGGELVTGGDGDSVEGVLSEQGAKIALGNNANAVLSLDLISDGGAGNRTDDGLSTGAVSGRGTKIAIEVFATGVRTSLVGVRIKFRFDASLLSYVKAENSAFPLAIPDGSVGTNLAATTPATLAASGFLARAEFETAADVTGREFSIGIESVTLAESSASQDEITTTSEISFNAMASPDFDGDGTVGFPDFLAFAGSFGSSRGDARYEERFDLDGDGSVAFSDFLIFAGAFGSRVPTSGGGGGGGTPPAGNPDLIVESPSVDDNTLTAGQSFTLRATVRNQGNASAASTTLRYFRSSNATIVTNDTEVGTDAVSPLSAGATSSESIRLNAPSDAGTYYYGACVDGVSGENDTANNCSRGVMVTVARVSSGLAPADQNEFNRLAVGKRIRAETWLTDIVSAGRSTTGFRRHGARYTYTSSGANTGQFVQVWDDTERLGGRCTTQLTFTSTTTGTATWSCVDGTTVQEQDWKLSELSTPVFVGASADTLHFAILDTWQAGQRRAYDLQLRKKTPQGRWNDVCVTFNNGSDRTITTYAGPWIYSPDLEPNTTYEFRYRYRNSSSCDTGSPGPWSPIVEGTTADRETDGGSGGGGGTGNLGTCRSGLVVCPQGNCVHPNGTRFSVDASGRGSFGFITAGTGITIRSSNQTFVAEKRSDNCWIVREAR